nr:unnamed protein product [Naegleria fowleri]
MCVLSCLFLSFSLMVALVYCVVPNEITNEKIDELRNKMQRRKNYLDVKTMYVQQKADMDATGKKKKLFDSKNCIEFAGNYIWESHVAKSDFDSLLQTKQTQLQNFLSLYLETDNIITMVQNSADYLIQDVTNYVRNHTVKAYTAEEYTEGDMNATLAAALNFTVTEGTLPTVQNSQLVRRIRNRIAVGQYHAVFMLANGKLYSTGVSQQFNLGRSSDTPDLNFTQPVEGLENRTILQFHTNLLHTLVLTDDGVYSFGDNDKCQLGNGKTSDSKKAIKVMGFAWNNISQIAAGHTASYAIDTNGKVWAWGDNSFGQLGDRTGGAKARPFPMFYNGTFYGKKALRVCGGYDYGAVLSTDGELFTFGSNSQGQLGIPTTTTKTIEPVRIPLVGALSSSPVIDIQCGYQHVVALLLNGDVVTWGLNSNYQLGDGTITSRYTPQKLIFPAYCNASTIAAGWHTNFATCENNDVYVWGWNSNGEAGLGHKNPITTPLKHTYNFDGKVLEIASSRFHTFAITSDGKYHGTGVNDVKNVFFRGNTLTTSFQVVDNYLKHTIPWQLRKMPYFEAADRIYALIADGMPPTRPQNGFNMYYKNRNETEKSWRLVEYNPETNSGFPVSIYSSHFLKLDEYVYFFGGFINDHVSDKIYRASFADVETTWEQLNYTLPYKVAGGMTYIVNEYFYIFGGIVSMYNENDGSYNEKATNTILRAPLSNISDWSVYNNRLLPATLHSGHIGVVWPHLYIFGGCQNVFKCDMNIFRALLVDVGTWEMTFGLLPHFYGNAVLVQTNDYMYLFGGFADPERPGGRFIARGSKQDIVGSWMAIPDLIPDFMASAGALSGNHIVLVGYDFRQNHHLDVDSDRVGETIEIQGE